MVIITRGGIIPGGMLAEAMDITHILPRQWISSPNCQRESQTDGLAAVHPIPRGRQVAGQARP